MNRFIIIMCMAMGTILCHAQSGNKNQENFDAFRSEIHGDFESFRAQIMRDYIEFIKNPWKEFESVPSIPKPKIEPAPPVVIFDKDILAIKNNPIVIDNIIRPLPVKPQPQPIEEIPENNDIKETIIDISFFGTPLYVKFHKNGKYKIGNISEENVANALAILATKDYDNLIRDCLKIRERHKLCDWAYLLLVQQISDTICSKYSNESSLMAGYLLLQSGYKIRLAYLREKLYVLYASSHNIFDKSSYLLDGENYYGLEELPSHLMISKASFPKEQSISLQILKQPLLKKALSPKRVISSKAFPEFKFEVQANMNLLSFYDTYPSSYYNDNYMTQWALYANTPLDSNVVTFVYSRIKSLLKGLSETECVERLLNLVQTGFVYEYDDKVWGYDRTFFSEETLYYPYCDCEDRSVILTRLVRDLLGLECVLVYYPGHLACAINFTHTINGDYIVYEGKKFVICDPTYIGAPIGKTMPGMNNSKANVIVLR